MKNALKDIYFYNAARLANDLKNGVISEYRAVKHLIATMVIGGIGFEIPISVAPSESYTSLARFAIYIVMFIITGIISYYGVWLTYQVNNKGDGKDFFLRFAALTLPIGIQLLVLFLWVGLALAVLGFSFGSLLGVAGWYVIFFITFLTAIAFTAMFFIRMRNYIAIASGLNE